MMHDTDYDARKDDGATGGRSGYHEECLEVLKCVMLFDAQNSSLRMMLRSSLMNSPANWMQTGQRSRSGLFTSTLFGGCTKVTHGVAKELPITISSKKPAYGDSKGRLDVTGCACMCSEWVLITLLNSLLKGGQTLFIVCFSSRVEQKCGNVQKGRRIAPPS